jgi:hypothetical protein
MICVSYAVSGPPGVARPNRPACARDYELTSGNLKRPRVGAAPGMNFRGRCKPKKHRCLTPPGAHGKAAADLGSTRLRASLWSHVSERGRSRVAPIRRSDPPCAWVARVVVPRQGTRRYKMPGPPDRVGRFPTHLGSIGSTHVETCSRIDPAWRWGRRSRTLIPWNASGPRSRGRTCCTAWTI